MNLSVFKLLQYKNKTYIIYTYIIKIHKFYLFIYYYDNTTISTHINLLTYSQNIYVILFFLKSCPFNSHEIFQPSKYQRKNRCLSPFYTRTQL